MHLLFDLDGTLPDPGVGITRCLQHALERMGRGGCAVGYESEEELRGAHPAHLVASMAEPCARAISS